MTHLFLLKIDRGGACTMRMNKQKRAGELSSRMIVCANILTLFRKHVAIQPQTDFLAASDATF